MVKRRPPKSGFGALPFIVVGLMLPVVWVAINPQLRAKLTALVAPSKSANKLAEKSAGAAKKSSTPEADPFADESAPAGHAELEQAEATPVSRAPLPDNVDNPFEEDVGTTKLVANETAAPPASQDPSAADPFADFETGENTTTGATPVSRTTTAPAPPLPQSEEAQPEELTSTPESTKAPKLSEEEPVPELTEETPPPRATLRRTNAGVARTTGTPPKRTFTPAAKRQVPEISDEPAEQEPAEDFEKPVAKPKRKISQLRYEEPGEPQELDLQKTEPQSLPQGQGTEEILADDAGIDLDLNAVRGMIQNGEESKAHKVLSNWYWKFPENRELFQEDLEGLAQQIYFSPQPHYEEPYLIQSGDRLSHIAEQYQVSWRFLSKLNQVDPRKIRAGKKLKVFQGPFAASIDLSDFELTIHHNGLYVKKYKIGIGKQNSSPIGEFLVREKLENPTYYGVDGNVVDADDPLNPLGERWIDIGDGFGIHGTTDPKSVGSTHSKGCIRMLNSDVDEVYDLLTLGSSVKIQR